jgi:hypothetical protein
MNTCNNQFQERKEKKHFCSLSFNELPDIYFREARLVFFFSHFTYFKMEDDELQAIRARRLAELQAKGGQPQQVINSKTKQKYSYVNRALDSLLLISVVVHLVIPKKMLRRKGKLTKNRY